MDTSTSANADANTPGPRGAKGIVWALGLSLGLGAMGWAWATADLALGPAVAVPPPLPAGRGPEGRFVPVAPELDRVVSLKGAEAAEVPEVGADVGRRAPDFTLPDLDGTPIALSALRGRAVVLNFWASYCPPCRREMPAMAEAARDFPEVLFVGINVGEPPEVAGAFARQVGADYPILRDARGAVAVAYRVANLPATFFLDEEGVIVDRAFRALSADELRESVRKLRRNPQ